MIPENRILFLRRLSCCSQVHCYFVPLPYWVNVIMHPFLHKKSAVPAIHVLSTSAQSVYYSSGSKFVGCCLHYKFSSLSCNSVLVFTLSRHYMLKYWMWSPWYQLEPRATHNVFFSSVCVIPFDWFLITVWIPTYFSSWSEISLWTFLLVCHFTLC